MRYHCYMLRRISTALFSLLFLTLLSACGFSSAGTIPSGTPDLGSGTPAVISTAGDNPSPIVTAPATAVGSVYAFVRANQLWMTTDGTSPMQVTHFTYTNLPDISWHQPLWSPGDHFMAFIVSAHPAGQGGGGCPAPDYGANGALYIMNTVTHQMTTLSASPLSISSSNTIGSSPHNDAWQNIFWEDSTHVLAWYNSTAGSTSSAAGLYRYDVLAGKLTQVITLRSLGVATLFNAQPNMPLLLSMRYSNGELFYQVVVHPFAQQSQIVIYQHSVVHPEQASSRVFEAGSTPWCVQQRPGSFVKPGWDVSHDGEQLVMQVVSESGGMQSTGTITVLNLKDGVTTALFTSVSTQWLNHDLMLTWGPDNQTVIANVAVAAPLPDGTAQSVLYSATLANPSAIQQYMPVAGRVVWRANSSAFALENLEAVPTASAAIVYLFVPGSPQGLLLLTDAQEFVWG
jgi:hypothetical protein